MRFDVSRPLRPFSKVDRLIVQSSDVIEILRWYTEPMQGRYSWWHRHYYHATTASLQRIDRLNMRQLIGAG